MNQNKPNTVKKKHKICRKFGSRALKVTPNLLEVISRDEV